MILQKKIIKLLNVKPKINPRIEITNRIIHLKEYLLQNIHLQSLIVAISGGQDSTLTGKLCQITIEQLRKEQKNKSYKFIALRLPYGIQKDEEDCKTAIKFINPDEIITINIKNSVLSSELSLNIAGIKISDHVKGNEKARERMKIQYSVAAMKNGIVVGTSNAAEIMTGFFTKHGDHGIDINLISQLNKRQGRLILKELKCPKNLYLKTPTADLEDNNPQKPDELVLGVKYSTIDSYLEGKQINILDKKIIEKLYLNTQHKRYPINIG
ncbi:ammonia-dependent NAD(+) synthetase [Buchnera aphidicola]|uniref:NH(3)-dependent NAD(+) synthetase n=1 Tax=Buchnera aphidicola (Aphis nerii) TaxID=1241835 RepID=A0A4D6XNJ6_9GAMM|nr:ammonia-dependent NAD(+) synthetase [Buchnera aphidicola]QCI18732.1 ammonia-dependent NAD(+) synthetase [Buchnera aphidicola (Aphis nerii)]